MAIDEIYEKTKDEHFSWEEIIRILHDGVQFETKEDVKKKVLDIIDTKYNVLYPEREMIAVRTLDDIRRKIEEL